MKLLQGDEEKEENADFIANDEMYIEPMPGLRLIQIPNFNDELNENLTNFLILNLVTIVQSYLKKYDHAYEPLVRSWIKKYNFQVFKKSGYYKINSKKITVEKTPRGFFNVAALRGNANFYKWENIYTNCYDFENAIMNISPNMPLFQTLKAKFQDQIYKIGDIAKFSGNWFLNPEAALESWRFKMEKNQIKTVMNYRNICFFERYDHCFQTDQDIHKLSDQLLYDSLVIHFFDKTIKIKPCDDYDWPHLKTSSNLAQIKSLKGVKSTIKWCGIVFLDGFVNYKDIHTKGGCDLIRVLIVQSKLNKKRKGLV